MQRATLTKGKKANSLRFNSTPISYNHLQPGKISDNYTIINIIATCINITSVFPPGVSGYKCISYFFGVQVTCFPSNSSLLGKDYTMRYTEA